MVEPLFFASLAFLFFALLWSSLMVYLRTWRFWRFLPSTFLLYSTLPRSLPNKGLLVFVIVQTLSRVTVVLSWAMTWEGSGHPYPGRQPPSFTSEMAKIPFWKVNLFLYRYKIAKVRFGVFSFLFEIQIEMPQLDKLTYFSQFFWLCLLLFTFYILLFNNNNGILGISRILKLRNQLLSRRGGEIQSKDPKNLEDISRKGFSTGLSYMYSSLSEVSQWCKTVDYLGKRRKITLISDFGEISGSRGMERQILYLISKSSYNTSSSRITCWKNIMLTHVPHGQGSIISWKPSDNLSIGSPKRMEKSQKHFLYVLLFRDSKKQASFSYSCFLCSDLCSWRSWGPWYPVVRGGVEEWACGLLSKEEKIPLSLCSYLPSLLQVRSWCWEMTSNLLVSIIYSRWITFFLQLKWADLVFLNDLPRSEKGKNSLEQWGAQRFVLWAIQLL